MSFDERYLNNRLKYHTASRLPKQAGDSLAASFNTDGHTVTTNQVWASPADDFPYQSLGSKGISNDPVGGTTNLIEVFKVGAVSGAFWSGGTVWTNSKYPAVKLYENVPVQPVNGSNGNVGGTSAAYFQSFEILAGEDGISSGTIRVMDWINPVAAADPSTSAPEAGFTGIFKYAGTTLQDDTNWTLDKGNWEFVYMAGLLTFEYYATPEKLKKVTYKDGAITQLTVTAFKYAGKYLTDSLTDLSTPIDEVIFQITSSGVTEPDAEPGTSSSLLHEATVNDGKVTIKLKKEVLGIQQLDNTVANSVYEDVYPDESYSLTNQTTTLFADFGDLLSEDASFNWRITYRV